MNSKAHKFCKYLGKISVKCQDLIKNFKPEYLNTRKRIFFEKALYCHRKQKGIIRISRVGFFEAKEKIDSLVISKSPFEFENVPHFYDYSKDNSNNSTALWYVNFADPQLFGFYDGDLFAQDEIQTLEFPLLASCMLYLDSLKNETLPSRTVVSVPAPANSQKKFIKCYSPYLFENVPYWISVNTSPILKDGSKGNIYGRAFSTAPKEQIESGIKIYEPELKANIIAMAAPDGGYGAYKDNQIAQIIETLICSYSAAVKQTKMQKKEICIIHTGNWGCGAFGGNKELMYLCQFFSASVCKVDKLVFHACDDSIIETAMKKLDSLPEELTVADFLSFIKAQNYKWNMSDGN